MTIESNLIINSVIQKCSECGDILNRTRHTKKPICYDCKRVKRKYYYFDKLREERLKKEKKKPGPKVKVEIKKET